MKTSLLNIFFLFITYWVYENVFLDCQRQCSIHQAHYTQNLYAGGVHSILLGFLIQTLPFTHLQLRCNKSTHANCPHYGYLSRTCIHKHTALAWVTISRTTHACQTVRRSAYIELWSDISRSSEPRWTWYLIGNSWWYAWACWQIYWIRSNTSRHGWIDKLHGQ